MATKKQTAAAKKNVKKAQEGAKKTLADMQKSTPGRSKMGRDELARALGRN